MNLLRETIDAITDNHQAVDKIIFIGSEFTGHQCTWKEFEKLADVEYDESYGAQKVACDLVIVFKDGSKLLREEYDGSEWWKYQQLFKRPKKSFPIKSLVVPNERVGWETLAEINDPNNSVDNVERT